MKLHWRQALLNFGLLVAGMAAILLLYALATRQISPRVDTRRAESTPLVGEIIQVEVLNGSGETGLAARTRSYLRERGFDVVEVDDYEHYDVTMSTVVDRVGDPEAARRLARVLGVSEAHIEQQIVPDLFVDASIILGHDFQTLKPFR